MLASNALLVSNFVGYLQYECDATEKTIAAHEQSVAHFAAWLEPACLTDATRIMLQLYIADSLSQGTSARTVARRLSHIRRFYQVLMNEKESVSGIRRFYELLIDEEEIVSNPTTDLEMPKHWTTAKAKGTQHSVAVATWVRLDIDAY